MPKCYGCKRPVPSGGLRPFGKNNRGWPEDELGCSNCRRMRLTQVAEEVTMSKKSERKPVFSLNVFEEGKNGQGEMNYSVEVSAQIGGFNMSFERTTDEIREYFTAKKERNQVKAKERKLRAVTENEE